MNAQRHLPLMILTGLISLFSSKSEGGETLRSKNIHFEDSLVEGINRRPLDSFNQISQFDAEGQNHLYKKRASFTDRNTLLFLEMEIKR